MLKTLQSVDRSRIRGSPVPESHGRIQRERSCLFTTLPRAFRGRDFTKQNALAGMSDPEVLAFARKVTGKPPEHAWQEKIVTNPQPVRARDPCTCQH